LANFSCSAVSAKAFSAFSNRLRNPVSLPDTFPHPGELYRICSRIKNQIIADSWRSHRKKAGIITDALSFVLMS
jgi:hypothetical protein